ncbi:UCH domain-containing protein, partial [Cephalotus follicularis]
YGLSLDVTEEMSMTGALSFYITTEESSNVSCGGCWSKVPARKRVLLDERASFLILHLKILFSLNDKIKGHINFSLSLNMVPYSSSVEDMDYDLYGFIVHAG